MDFGQRLKNMRIEHGLTQKELASAVGVSVVAVQNWENGKKKPMMDMILSLGNVFQVSIDTLLGFSALPRPQDTFSLSQTERQLLKNYRSLDAFGRKAVEVVCAIEAERTCAMKQAAGKSNLIELRPRKTRERYIPRYSTPAAAGYSVPLDGEDFEMLLVDDSVPPQADFAVDIQGDSMYPYIHDGETVYVMKDAELSIGDVGIFSVDGAMYCKQYFVDDDGNLILISANPELRDSNVFVSADSDSFVKVYGKVLLGRRIKLPDYLLDM